MGARNPGRSGRLILRDDLRIDQWAQNYGDWEITAACECGNTRRLRAPALLRLDPPPVTIADLKQRLRCIRCGRRGGELVPVLVTRIRQ
jgi:hypothetical protein